MTDSFLSSKEIKGARIHLAVIICTNSAEISKANRQHMRRVEHSNSNNNNIRRFMLKDVARGCMHVCWCYAIKTTRI